MFHETTEPVLEAENEVATPISFMKIFILVHCFALSLLFTLDDQRSPHSLCLNLSASARFTQSFLLFDFSPPLSNMFSKISLVALTVLATFAGVSHSAPLDVWKPHQLTPTAGQILYSGDSFTLKWETADQPAHISNTSGKIVLATNYVLDYDHPLAQGFNITSGQQTITVPNVAEAGPHYQFVLFGDSGNYGPTFAIAPKAHRASNTLTHN
ncbi:hypothetical protein NP233_g10799 [Leucocoprinus birnbaumii]|uniref:Yeast cell wall synthesis Kre9/Knh1-like N-terminal domain-containing protein n=1 Tax=Leucocoprinus birnbaumii TaxID=56174 RepID=A0AAD5VIL9_9AGAR|nr:hypothetical protein NP233_g10799 [Leucocoprinus birnbaumii]